MNDQDIESLLRRYRPAAQISKFPDCHISKSPRTWPWAVAAAALLAISVGLHAAVVSEPDPSTSIDALRVQSIAEELGGSPGSEVLAEWIVRREVRAEQDARMARASTPEFGRQ